MAPGIRNVIVPSTQYTKVAEPTTDACAIDTLGMKRTMVMKITSISTRESTRGNISPVRCSERRGTPMMLCMGVGAYCPSGLLIAALPSYARLLYDALFILWDRPIVE